MHYYYFTLSFSPYFELVNHLRTWNILLSKCKSINIRWISQMIAQVLKWTFTSNNSLDKEAQHGKHSQTSILNFLHLELIKSLWITGQSKWIELSTWVELVVKVKWTTSGSVVLNPSHEENVEEDGDDDALGVDEGWFVQIVDTVIREDEGLVLEPDSLWEVDDASAFEVFWDEATEGAEHGPAGVDYFNGAVAGEGFWVGGEAGCVPAIVTWEFPLEVAWGAGDWAQEGRAVGAIPERREGEKGVGVRARGG